VVEVQVANLDGSPCAESPLIEIVNDGFATAIDLNSLTVDQAASPIRFVMAQEPGAGRLTVRACGREATLGIVNVGTSASSKGCPTGVVRSGDVGGARQGCGWGISVEMPRWSRMRRTIRGSSIVAIRVMWPPQRGQASTSRANARRMGLAQA
jgi:hypothetical protein